MNLRRVATFALAFAVALVVADRMMTARSVADDAATTRPATATAPAATRPTIPADAQAILDRITAAYAQTPLEVAGTFEQHFDVAGIRREQSLAIRGVARSDTTFRHETANALVVVADGKEGHVYDVQRKQFRSEPLNVSKARAIVAIQNPALAVAIEGNATLGLVPDAATNVHRLAADPLDGVGFDLEGTSVEVRVAAGGTIDRVRYDFVAYLTGRGAADVKRAEAIVRYAKSGTAEGDANADARFAFVPPADARELTGSDGGDAPVEVLEKGPAPAFALKDLDGGEVKLAEQKGHVVVLDFWATWCGPCQLSLPALSANAQKFADRGVRVFSINREEDASTVRDYWTQAKLAGVRPLLDPDGATASAYGVSAIPHTVIIDAQGTIRRVIVGTDQTGGQEKVGAAIGEALGDR